MPKIGVLLTDRASGGRIGVIEFDPSGMLVSHVFPDTVHPFALNPVIRTLKEPLYVKYAELMKKKRELPADIIEHEAKLFVEKINGVDQPMTVGEYAVKAEVVHTSK
jgi:hypothetical protein